MNARRSSSAPRARSLALSLALFTSAAVLSPAPTRAQQTGARRPVHAGDVTGLDLGLEGALTATRGGPLRWLVTTYEVVHLRDLRPAVGTRVRVLTSLSQDTPAVEVTTDAFGRAAVSLDVPADAPDSFRCVIEAVSPSHVQRRFELDVRTSDPRELTLTVPRARTPRDGTLRVWGRLAHRDTHAGLAAARVDVQLLDANQHPVGAPAQLRTDASGLFVRSFRLRHDIDGAVWVRARTPEAERWVETMQQATVGDVEAPPLLVGVAPARWIVQPGEEVGVDVVVRTPDGRPVSGATVRADSGAVTEPRTRRLRTDARGRTHFTWRAPALAEGFADVSISVQAAREGVGSTNGSATVRVAGSDYAMALAVEAGALPGALGGKLFVRVLGIDGRPAAAGVPVVVSGPRIAAGPLRATTDDDGVAVVELELGAAAAGQADRCGGDAATSVSVQVGQGARGTTMERCIPIDPDAAARVRVEPGIVVAGAHARVEVARAPVARGLPVAVTLLVREGAGMRAVASHVLPPNENITEVVIPRDVVGHVIVRARPLFGSERQEVRGSTASLWSTAGERFGADLRLDGGSRTASVTLRGAARGDRSAVIVALPLDEARELSARLSAEALGPLGDLRRAPGLLGEHLALAALATHTPLDTGAPAVLRGRDIVPVPAPEAPASLGLLRDPWRARARFVGGRLALILRAVEAYVVQAIPEHIDDVAVHGPRGWDFNAQIVDAIAAAGRLGGDGARGLGGEPLSIVALRSLDPAFTYDNVARRVTRERMFKLLLLLRTFVQQQSLDLRWSWQGDPTTWLEQAIGRWAPGVGSVQRTDLVDGWGHPFVLRPTPGGRARFTALVPVQGYELLSGGPDGRVGNGDDLWDPTARVLPTGTVYARAVNEDAVVARLRGVELGRTTLEMAAGYFSAGVPYVEYQHGSAVVLDSGADELPPLLNPDPDPLALRRPSEPGDGAGGALATLHDDGASVQLALDEEPRAWGAVVAAWTPDGFPSVAIGTARAGAPVLVDATPPERIRVGERVSFDMHVTSVVPDDQSLTLETRMTRGRAAATSTAVRVGGEQSTSSSVSLDATEVGDAQLDILLTNGNGDVVSHGSHRIVIDEGMHPILRRAAFPVRDGEWSVSLDVPDGARRAQGRLVLMAPRAFADHPGLAELRENDPALLAWSYALSGRRPSAALRAALLRSQLEGGGVQGHAPSLSTACAITAWSADGVDDVEASAARERAVSVIGDIQAMDDRDGNAGIIRTQATMLVALATGGMADPIDADDEGLDPVATTTMSLATSLRAVLRSQRGEPSLLARAAAALLTASPGDLHGIAMLDLAAAHLESNGAGALVVPSEERRDRDEVLDATLALALAAHQAGRPELASRLLRGALSEENVLVRLGGEPAFWLLAAGAYGVLGVGDPSSLSVEIDGRSVRASLHDGLAVVPLAGLSPGSSRNVTVRAGGPAGVLARVEASYGAPFVARNDGPLALAIDGDLGNYGGVAALELSITARDRVRTAIVEVQLPAGVAADDALVAAVRGSTGVSGAEAREPGFLRIVLSPMERENRVVVPLPLAWRAQGSLRGLGVIAYPESRPSAMSSLAPRPLAIE